MGQILGSFCFEGLKKKSKVPDHGRYNDVRYTHLQPPPEGSLLLLGHLSIEVPEEQNAKLFYSDLLGCNKVAQDELSVKAGASQLVLPLGSTAYKWPGEIRIWVEDLRETVDMTHMLGPTLGLGLMQEYVEGVDFGTYEMLVRCPFSANRFRIADTPPERAAALRGLFPGPGEGERRSNVLALVDAVHMVPKGLGMVETVAHFYEQALSACVTKRSHTFCIVHFSPSKDLHQTLKFIEDPDGSTEGGCVCIYLASREAFKAAFERCEAVGSPPWGAADAALEFRVRSHGGQPLPVEHLVRWAKHPACGLQGQ